MKTKVFTLLIVVVMLLMSFTTFAAEEFTNEELKFYEENLKLYNNSQLSFETGLNFGELEHTINDGDLNLKNKFEHKMVTGKLGFDWRVNSSLIKEVGLSYETDIKNYDKELNQEYTNSTNGYFAGGLNNTNIDGYDKIDINLFFNRDIAEKTTKVLFGLGYEKEEKTYNSDKGTLHINDNSIKYNINYDNLKYDYEADKPYIAIKATSASSNKIRGGLTAGLKVYPKITSTNTITIDNNKIKSDFDGWGIRYDLKLMHNISKNLMLNIGYNYNYKNLESDNKNSGAKLVNSIGIPVNTNAYDLTEEVKEGNHKIYLSMILQF